MEPKTFAIDTRWLESRVAAAGTYTHIKSLGAALLRLDSQNRYRTWGTPLGFGAPNLEHKQFGGYYRRTWQLAWKTVDWPTCDLVGPRCDLWHFTNNVAPPTRKPFVLTIHDLAFVHHPDFIEPGNLEYLRRFVPDSLERASQVVAVSQSTKEAIVDEFGTASGKIRVTPLAADPAFARPVSEAQLARVKDKYGIDGEYFLAVGTLEPRKNLRALLLAFAGIRKHTSEQLVVVGGQGWLFDETKELLRKLGLGDRVIFTDYAPAEELPGLYAGAKLFVFPTFYEGFGIPVLEAMLAGTPVICSNTSSLPEVAGAAALYFDPNDTKALALALQRTLEDEPLRTRLAEAGREQAGQFSWKRTAELTLAAYRKALIA